MICLCKFIFMYLFFNCFVQNKNYLFCFCISNFLSTLRVYPIYFSLSNLFFSYNCSLNEKIHKFLVYLYQILSIIPKRSNINFLCQYFFIDFLSALLLFKKSIKKFFYFFIFLFFYVLDPNINKINSLFYIKNKTKNKICKILLSVSKISYFIIFILKRSEVNLLFFHKLHFHLFFSNFFQVLSFLFLHHHLY